MSATITQTLDSIEIEGDIESEIERLATVAAILEWGCDSDALLDVEIAIQKLGAIKERMREKRA